MERATGKDGADRRDQRRRIGHRADRAWAARWLAMRCLPMPADGRSRHAPSPTHPGHAVGLAGAGRDGPAHRLDLRRSKGRLPSRVAIFASSSPRSSGISPSLALSRPLSSSSPSAGRVARLASPAARKASCQPVSVAAVTPRRAGHCLQVPATQQPNDGVALAPPAAASARLGRRRGRPRSPSGFPPPTSNPPHPGSSWSPPIGIYPLVRCLSQPWCGGGVRPGVGKPMLP